MAQVKLLSSDAIVPTRSLPGSAGFDLSSVEEVTIPSRKWGIVPTGLAIQVPFGTYGRIAPRSGLAAKNGIDVLAGVVDYGYTGEVKVILMNNGEKDFLVNKGDRIAQFIIEKIEYLELELVENLDKSERGENGFGSTGK